MYEEQYEKCLVTISLYSFSVLLKRPFNLNYAGMSKHYANINFTSVTGIFFFNIGFLKK